ncbi:hypothetical protein GCM10027610_104470 [Dactylosporangium cerinum]
MWSFIHRRHAAVALKVCDELPERVLLRAVVSVVGVGECAVDERQPCG